MKKQTSQPAEKPKTEIEPEIEWPRIYRIRLKGHLDPNESDVLAGMQIQPRSGDRPTGTTVLVGMIRDDAELFGVLNTLYDLRLSLLSVEVAVVGTYIES